MSAETLTSTANCRIRKVGSDDPVFCQWSFVHGAYLCDFGGDDDRVGYFKDTPTVVSGNNYVGRVLKFRSPLAHGGGASSSVTARVKSFFDSMEAGKGKDLVFPTCKGTIQTHVPSSFTRGVVGAKPNGNIDDPKLKASFYTLRHTYCQPYGPGRG